MRGDSFDIIKKHKEIPIIFVYYIIVLVISIYLILDYWDPVPLDIFDYTKEEKTIKYANGTEQSELVNSNQTMAVSKITIKHNRNASNSPEISNIVVKENGTVIQNKSNFAFGKNIDREFQLVVLVLAFGIIGGATHGLSSLVTYVGNRRHDGSWTIWYFGRPVIAGIAAIVFYLLIRGGILSINAQPADLNYFGVAAISVTAGLMATEATKKLRDIFMTLFGTQVRESGDESQDKTDSKIILPYTSKSIKVNEELDLKIIACDFKDRPLKEKEIIVNLVDNQENIELSSEELKTDGHGKTTLTIKGKNPGSVILNIYLKDNVAVMDALEIDVSR
ncbi:MAG TPA: hypothetical protein VJ767_01100 [Nitrososphaeraceae archaeon]|nr:hypothetical protein [Nitrososphaeraceae archaeon]